MGDSAVKVEEVGKRYRIGETQRPAYGTLRDALTSFARRQADRLRHPFRQRRSRESTIWALRDVSFEVRRGEVVGIIGRNGAGKSTLLKILSRITEPTEGRVTLHGRVGSLLEVGTGFHLELTGRENIFLNGAILGMKKAEIQRKFDEIVAFAEIDRFIDTPVKHYSSGMHVRLAFAVAAHLEPEILLIDEVLAVGDASFQKKCLGKMGEVTKEGRTILFVSHNMAAIRSLCSTALLVDNGRITDEGPTGEVLDTYMAGLFVESESRIKVAELPRTRRMGERLRITSVTLNDERPIGHGEPLAVSIEWTSRDEVPGAAFRIGFCNLAGARVMTIDSDLPGRRINIPPGTSGRAVARIERLPLEPDSYLLDVACRSGDIQLVDHLEQFALIRVFGSAVTTSPLQHNAPGHGGTRWQAAWEHLRSDAPV